MTLAVRCIALFLFFLLNASARSEGLVVTVEPSRIAVSSSFSSGTVVVFGAVQTNTPPAAPYDVAVIVSGPPQAVVTRRKGRIGGIWVNQDSRTFRNVPSFLGVNTSRPPEALASQDVLRRQGIGLKYALFDAGVPPDGDDPYLVNLVNIRIQQGLFNERATGVTFLSQTAFRTEIPLPDNVPVGDYTVNLKLFQNGNMIGETASSFEVAKVGVEEFVAKAATNHSLFYGLSIMSMGLFTGWLASVAFRRD